jgi:triosephosphate isomerase
LKTPLILTNFKTYESATGAKAMELAKAHQIAAEKTGANFAVAVQAVDIFRVSQAVNIPVFAQHCDDAVYGSKTGWIMTEALKEAGAVGTILNHSEHRFEDMEQLGKSLVRAKEAGLITCVCAETAEEGAEIAKRFSPDFVAVEPPELIGGDISVSTAQPELISDSVQMINGNVLVGAGVKNGNDVKIAVELGAKGVLLASGGDQGRISGKRLGGFGIWDLGR